MAGLRKAWKTRLGNYDRRGGLGGDGFPSASLSPLEIACGDSHIPTASTTIPRGHFYRANDGDISIEP